MPTSAVAASSFRVCIRHNDCQPNFSHVKDEQCLRGTARIQAKCCSLHLYH